MPILKTDLPRSFPKGAEFTNSLVNAILRELWRWRRIQATAPLTVDYAESDQPPILSYIPQNFVSIAWGNTGSGFSAATTSGGFPVPASQSVQLYKVAPGNPPVLTNWQVVTAWNPYSSGSIASSKTALFGQTTDGTWWVITADC